jgi:hypothetical protein
MNSLMLSLEFARILATIPITNLRTFILDFAFEQPFNEDFAIPSGLDPSDQVVDPLSITLHNLSLAPNLQTFYLGGPKNESTISITPSLF